MWFKSHLRELSERYGSIRGFYSSFNDPYFNGGKLDSRALSLSGSWLDSGINSLSAIADLVKDIKPEGATFTRIHGVDIQSNAFFSFKSATDGRGYGDINTGWTAGSGAKSSKFFFSEKGTIIELDHSNHSVRLYKDRNSKVLFQADKVEDRVVQHYIHVFREFLGDYRKGRSNLEFSRLIHSLLFAVVDCSSVGCNGHGI